MIRRALFWLRVALMAAKEQIFGIRCGCGARAMLPVPPGWRFETVADGNARWRCPECWRQDAEPAQW